MLLLACNVYFCLLSSITASIVWSLVLLQPRHFHSAGTRFQLLCNIDVLPPRDVQPSPMHVFFRKSGLLHRKGYGHYMSCSNAQDRNMLFSGLSKDVRPGSSPGSGWATQGHSETCHACVLSVIVLLEGEPSPQSEVLRTLEQVFIKDLSGV